MHTHVCHQYRQHSNQLFFYGAFLFLFFALIATFGSPPLFHLRCEFYKYAFFRHFFHHSLRKAPEKSRKGKTPFPWWQPDPKMDVGEPLKQDIKRGKTRLTYPWQEEDVPEVAIALVL